MKHRSIFVAGALCALASMAQLASAQVVAPAKAPGIAQQFSIVIDAGHGGSDSGLMSGAVDEKTIDLAVARLLRLELEKQGARVILTRASDKFLALQERVDVANKINPDCFISIHCNERTKTTSLGKASVPFSCQVAYYQPTSKLFADTLNASLTKSFRLSGEEEVEQLRYFVIRKATAPSAFVDGDYKTLASPEAQQKFAAALARGIEGYMKAKATTPTKAPILRDLPGVGKYFNAPDSRIPSYRIVPRLDKPSPMQQKPTGRYEYLGASK